MIDLGTVNFDASQHPIVRVTFDGSSAEDGDVRQFLTTLDTNLDRRLPYAIVIEAPALSALSPQHRDALAGWVQRRHSDLSLYCLAQAYAIPGVLGRMILRSIFMLHTPVNAYRVFSDRAEATTWCRQILAGKGVYVRPATEPRKS